MTTEDNILELAFLALTIAVNVLCWWRWWDHFNFDRVDLAKGFPLKQALKRILFPSILISLLLFQVFSLLYDSRSPMTIVQYSCFPIFLAGYFTIRAHHNYRRRIAGKSLPTDPNDIVTLNLRRK